MHLNMDFLFLFLMAGYLSVGASILAVLHGAHGGSVRPQPHVKTQAHQSCSRELTL